MHHLLAAIIATTAWLAPQGTWAQAIEPVDQPLVIGQPVVLRLQVRGFEIDPAQLGPDCIQVRLIQGEAELPADATQVHTSPLAEDGKVLVRVSHPAELHEPVLRARVQLRCGADFARELTLLVDPPPGPAKASRAPLAAGTVSSSGGPLRPPALVAPPGSPNALPRQAPRGAVPAGPSRTPIGEGDRLSLEEPPLDRLVSAVLAALALRQPDLLRPPAAARDHGLRPVEADWLRELQQMQEEQRQTRAQMAALQLRLERQESDTLQRWGAIAATAGGVLTGALLLRIARERLLPRLSDARRAAAQTDAPTIRPDPAISLDATELNHPSHPSPWREPPSRGPEPSMPSPGVSAMEATAAMPAHHSAAPENTPPIAGPLALTPLAAPAAAQPPRQWPGADFGEPSLAGNGHAPAVRQVDRMSADGYLGAAATILENALQTRPGKSPWLLLRLLDIYRAMDQPWNHERVSAQLEALYNLRVPPMGPPTSVDPGSQDEGPGLEDRPDLLDRLAQLWPQPPVTLDWLRGRLLRDRGLPAVDLATFRDLLFLYDLARQLEEDGAAA